MRRFRFDFNEFCTENSSHMRRTRRAAAPDVAPDETAESAASGPVASEQAAPETTPADVAAPAPGPPTKPSRRRPSRAKSAEVPAETPSIQVVDVEAPVVAEAETSATPSVRRGGRRRKPTEAVEAKTAETNSSDIGQTAAPAPEAVTTVGTDATPARRRGRRRESPPPADVSSITIDAVAEGVPTEEVLPKAAEGIDTPAETETLAKRRPGGRRTRTTAVPEANPLAENLPDVEAPVAEALATDAPKETPVRRRRRRRGEAIAPVAESPAVIEPEEEQEELPSASDMGTADDAATPEAEKEGERRGRRSRSRRRRRGSEVELPPDLSEAGDAGLILPEPVSVEEAPDDEDDDAQVLIAPPPPVYVAPRLVPPVFAPPSGAPLPRVRAALQRPQSGGLPRIATNDQSHAPFLFFVNAETAASGEVVDSQIRGAAAAGIHLYSGVMYLPLRNAYGDRSFGATDALVQQIMGADPDAYIMPRLQFVPTNYWARTHSDQMARYADGSEGDVSLASTEFWADCVDALEALISHFADPATPGGDRIIGFHLDRGEWFYDQSAGFDCSEANRLAFQNWLRAKYQFPYALRAAWYSSSATFEDAEIPAWPGATTKADDAPLYSGPRDGRWPDYALFSSDLVAQAITGLAEAVKTLSEGRLLVGVSYGYTLEFATRSDSGHLALAQVLASPHIDILAGPNSYTGRGAGSVGGFGAPIDSVALHGKLWLVEDDTKTFLADEETPDTYNPKIASGADTQAAHERHFGAALAHRAGVTWMDLWGQGWLDNPDIWREMGRLRDQAERLDQVSVIPTLTPDVVVFVDEASLAYFKNNPAGLGQALVAKSRDLLLRSGASVGFYLQSDVRQENLPDAKLYLFLNALRVTTEERRAIRERLHRPGKTLVWLYAPGLFDEGGLAEHEIGDTVGMALRLQPWNCRLGSQLTDARSSVTDRLRAGKRGLGQEDVINPSFAVTDPQALVLAEYTQTGGASLAVREQPGGWKSVFIGDPHLTNELLRGLYAYAGVPVYETQDDVVYAGEGVLLVHAPFTGQRTITLPRRATVYDVTEDKIVATQTRSFRVFLRARTTRLFLWGETEAIVAATGLALPTASQTSAEPLPEQDDVPEPPVNRPPPLRVRAQIVETASELSVTSHVESGDTEESVTGTELATALDVLEEALLPMLDEDETGEDPAATAGSEPAASARRSRWQRRRAAMRARRETERQARAAGEGAPESGDTANPPLDIATLLPDLPPRRKAYETIAPTEEE